MICAISSFRDFIAKGRILSLFCSKAKGRNDYDVRSDGERIKKY